MQTQWPQTSKTCKVQIMSYRIIIKGFHHLLSIRADVYRLMQLLQVIMAELHTVKMKTFNWAD